MKYANIVRGRVYAWGDVVWPNVLRRKNVFSPGIRKLITGKDEQGRNVVVDWACP